MAEEGLRKSVFVKLEKGEITTTRRELLSSKINDLEFLKSFREYKRLRLNELDKKNILKRKLLLVKNTAKEFVDFMPKIDRNMARIEREVDSIEGEAREKSDFAIERELRDIKAELDKLEVRE